MIRFTLPGAPVALERARVYRRQDGKTRGRTPGKSREFKERVSWFALRARPKTWNLDGSFELDLRIYIEDGRRIDASNVLKAVEDAMNKIAYHDDAQITRLLVSQGISRDQPRIEVTVKHVCLECHCAHEPGTDCGIQGTRVCESRTRP